jgi:hypothetical protein
MPSTMTWPSTRAPGTSSCIRLMVRRKVDLPQPEDPIRAVIRFGGMRTLTFFTARKSP